ncbi:ABC transporter permease [Sulfidibacter corallicola]|uniref:ABC transporter permease n=1 Tax=Sulfidibacter corallicola TaxID=2818388 RepID=A0A8A4TLS6_SULCO|nr:FtsX-like permease family protein [Sulfidibacter corallicola]QTD50510.1 ABC transporter permease [Sulfidibacter corallicola]
MWYTALLVGWRNLRRRRGRSMLTGSMFFFGTMFVVVSLGVADGTYDDMIRLATRTWVGDFQVLAENYDKKPSLFKTIDDPDAAAEALRAEVAGIAALAPRIESAALLSRDNATVGGSLLGIDLHREFRVTSFEKQLSEGAWWKPGTSWDDTEIAPIVLGSGLAKRLDAGLGERLAVITAAADGSTAADWFEVVGILDSGNDELDRTIACTPIAIAGEFLELGTRVHRLVGRMAARRSLAGGVNLPIQDGALSVMPWQELMPELDRAIAADREGLSLFVMIILLVVLLGCSNTMMMAILERIREIGVLQAIGTTPGHIIAFTLAEVSWLAVIGVLAGTLVGMGLNLLIGASGIPLGDESFTYGGMVLDHLSARNSLTSALIYPLAIAVSGILAGLVPAYKATRLSPVDAIRGASA